MYIECNQLVNDIRNYCLCKTKKKIPDPSKNFNLNFETRKHINYNI